MCHLDGRARRHQPSQTAVGRGGREHPLECETARTDRQIIQTNTSRPAAHLAKNIDRLTQLRASMRERMRASPLMDAATFARDMEDALRKMWADVTTKTDG